MTTNNEVQTNEIQTNEIQPIDIYLDFTAKNLVTISCTQYDKDARTLVIHLLDNGRTFHLDASKHELIFKMTKKDNKSVLNDCTINSDGTATFILSEQICIFAGIYDVQFMMADITDQTVIHTMPAKLNISKTAADNTAIESSDEFDTLNRLILSNQDVEDALLDTKQNMDTFLENADAQERLRQDNERIRSANENSRVEIELVRQTQEDERQTAEAERKQSENLRAENETARSNAENSRQNAENSRQLNESARLSEFSQMKTVVDAVNNTMTTNKPIWDDKYTRNEVDNKFSTLEMATDWKESVNTFADLSTVYPNPQDGWTVNVKDTDYTYRFSGSEWVVISANAIPKATQSVDGLLTKEDKTNYDDANSKKHTHTNKGVLDKLTQTLLDNWNSAYSHITDAIKHITADERQLWNTVSNKVDKISGKGLSTNDYTTSEKSKLAGIAENANSYTLPAASSTVLGGVKTGSNITNSSGTISLTKENVTSALGYTPGTSSTDTNTTYSLSKSGSTITLTGSDGSKTSVTDSDTDTTYGLATTSVNGLMSASDKVKLNGIASGAQVNTITGIKGNAESAYRTGNVNLTAANIGALPTSGGTMSGNIIFGNYAEQFGIGVGGAGLYIGQPNDTNGSENSEYTTVTNDMQCLNGLHVKGALTVDGSLNGTASKAIQDNRGQTIDATYINGLSVSGRTITYTKGDGSTGTITTQDTNTITGVKGNAESAYRTGNVNLTPANIGALPITGGTLTGDLRIKGSGNYGTKINLGDGDYVHICEPTDDCLEIKAKKMNFVTSDTSTTNFTLNGNPINIIKQVLTGSDSITGEVDGGWTEKRITFSSSAQTANPRVFIQQTGGTSIENIRAYNMTSTGFTVGIYDCVDFTTEFDWIAFWF